MRVNLLQLEPYGSLAETALGLGSGLTVVHGLNEAGKSTLLSAYADLLCGIRKNTPMDFVVTRAKLRIRALITMDDGSTLAVIRTAKNAPNDLIDLETLEPVPRHVRQALTWALDHNTLMARFGLDHQRLVAGGKQLVDGQGSLADIIFEARSGTDVRVLVDQLEARAVNLYKPHKSSTSDLIRANNRRDGLQSELKKAMATAEAVDAANARLREAELDLSRCRLEAERLLTEMARLTRLIGSWPHWEQYRARLSEFALADANGPRLSPDQLRTVTDTAARLTEIDADVRKETSVADTAQQELSALAVDENLLVAQVAIETLAKNKPDADSSRAEADNLSKQASGTSAEVSELLRRLGVHDVDEPLTCLSSITVAVDRQADLNSLADEKERLDQDIDEVEQSVNEASAQLQAVETEAESKDLQNDVDGEVDLVAVATARAHRDGLWAHVRRSWLNGAAVPVEFGSSPDELADRYETSVTESDTAADEQVEQAGRLTDNQRKLIEVVATRQATITERRRTLRAAEQSLAKVKQRIGGWANDWLAAADAAGLPPGLGVPGWREREELLVKAESAAESLRTLEREIAENSKVAAEWDEAVSTLAADLGQSIELIHAEGWFDKTKGDYDQAKSNKKVADLHRSNQSKALEVIKHLREEKSTLEQSLADIADSYGTDRDGLADLAARTEVHADALVALTESENLLKALYSESTLNGLTEELAGRDRDQLSVDLETVKDALDSANDAVSLAQEKFFQAKETLKDLVGRTGADTLRQELSQVTAQMLDIIEDYAITQLMHHLLTQELRAYLEAHRNPVLERAGSYLNRLTQGRYTALRAEGEGTERSLIVLDGNGEGYETTALSEGTASQLYLALSLAGVLEVQEERRRDGQENIPVMLDDVLIAFDDDRAASALQLLAEIGEQQQQQIVLFTHHSAVKERAGSIIDAASVISLAAPGLPK